MGKPVNIGTKVNRAPEEEGFALLISIIVLALFFLIGLYSAMNATTEIRISDNYESEIQARFAAYAGLDHARAAVRGLDFDDLLKGPDGIYDNEAGYLAQARDLGFRSPIAWSVARSLDVLDPSRDVNGLPDDGLLNTGQYQSIPGTILIPRTGIALNAPNPHGSGPIITARYFVKVTDNNGEASELAKDPQDNPFVDGDRLILVRSMGVAPTMREYSGATAHNNSVVVLEVRFKRRSTFDLDAPLLVHGTAVQSSSAVMFEGNSFSIRGGAGNPGIGTLDADKSDAVDPAAQIAAQVAPAQSDNIQGSGSAPSIQDLTAAIGSDPEKALLLDKNYLWNFTRYRVLQFADVLYQGSQEWTGSNAPDLGYYDPSLPPNAPGQRPRVTLVEGDLVIGGSTSGGGLLVVTGKLSTGGEFRFNGLILLVGGGDLDAGGTAWNVTGGIYVANIYDSNGSLNWGTARLSMRGTSALVFDRRMIGMAISLIPPAQVGFREVTSALDP